MFQMFPELALVLHALIYFYTKQHVYAHRVTCVILIISLGVFAKTLMKNTKDILPDYILFRPKGAFGCNGNCKVNCEHEVGMPSIHSMIAGYLSAIYKNPVFVVFALSRLGKNENPYFYHSISGCHTLPQIIVGYVLGYTFGLIT